MSALVEVDIEYLKRTITNNKNEFNESVHGHITQLTSDPNEAFSKINALNAIVCHQQILDLIENSQMQLNAQIASAVSI